MTPEDLARLHAQCFLVPRPWDASAFEGLLAGRGVFLCAQAQGFALGRVAGPEAEVLTLAVHPGLQRAGLGTRLMIAFEVAAKTRGAGDAFLEVAETNTAAIPLYRRLGYTQRGLRKDYYAGPKGDRIGALVMAKTL